MKRREFIGCFAAAAAMPASATAYGKPLLKVGLMSDTHIRNDKASCERVGMAWRLFRAEGVDMVANLGDIADHNYPKGYEGYRETVDEAWPQGADHPREVYVFAWHDYYGYKGDMNRSTPKWQEACAEAARLLKSPNGLYDSFVLKGYPFLVMPQWADFKKYEEMVSEAVEKNPGKPVFVCDHVPPFDTVYNSRIWGDKRRYDILKKYPMAVDLTGHVHQSLRIDTSVWQGPFTVINCGCLSTWGGNLVGTAPTRKPCFNVVVMDVFADRLELRRFDLRRPDREICADTRWVVPLPFCEATAPLSPIRRAKAMPVASFPAGAALSAKPDAVPFRSFDLSFPEAQGAGSFEYRIEILRKDPGGKWSAYARQDIFTEFYLEDFEKKGVATHSFPAGYFTPGEAVRFSVTPVNAYGRGGAPLMAEAKVPEKAKSGRLVWKSDDPMKECPCMTGLKGGKQLALDADGFYVHDTHEARLILPDGVWDGPAGTKFRFTVDMRMVQPGGGQWTLVLRNPVPLQNANQRIATPKGDSGLQRYVIEFEKPKQEYSYYFLIREGTPGRLRFEHVSIEVCG